MGWMIHHHSMSDLRLMLSIIATSMHIRAVGRQNLWIQLVVAGSLLMVMVHPEIQHGFS